MSSVFDRFRQPNGQANIANIMNQFRQVQQNPAQIGQLLFDSGRITKEQLEHIKGMNNPRDIGMYLLNQNKDFKQAYDTMKVFKQA